MASFRQLAKSCSLNHTATKTRCTPRRTLFQSNRDGHCFSPDSRRDNVPVQGSKRTVFQSRRGRSKVPTITTTTAGQYFSPGGRCFSPEAGNISAQGFSASRWNVSQSKRTMFQSRRDSVPVQVGQYFSPRQCSSPSPASVSN